MCVCICVCMYIYTHTFYYAIIRSYYIMRNSANSSVVTVLISCTKCVCLSKRINNLVLNVSCMQTFDIKFSMMLNI